MIILGFIIGMYGYLIFFWGITGGLSQFSLITLSILYWGLAAFVFRKEITTVWKRKDLTLLKNKWSITLLGLLFLQTVVNIVGALGPETAFDALWYHLTIPKIYLMWDKITFISGGLLYYSAMPQLTEMYYLVALSFQGEIAAKLVHCAFGLLCCAGLYTLSRKFLPQFFSLLVAVLFYSNLVVAWESTTAYIDLTRTFFELLTLFGILSFFQTRNKRWLIIAGIFLGMEIGTKLLSLGSLPIFVLLILIESKDMFYQRVKNCIPFLIACFFFSLPWLLFTYIHTGNPVYPIFTPYYSAPPRGELFNPFIVLSDIFTLFTRASDPISPFYLMIFPALFLVCKKFSSLEKILVWYCVLGVGVWYLTPQSGGGRFILPYLPGLSVLCGIVLYHLSTLNKKMYVFYLSILLSLSLITILYRGATNSRYLPVLMGSESRDAYLSRSLLFSHGDFYDIDGYFKQTIKPTDRVLLVGFHNLYYVNFPFIDGSFRKSTDTFNYVATQHTILPSEFRSWRKVYYNKITGVTLYKKP